jgi:hypothetical protein
MHRTQVAGIGQGNRKNSRDGITQKREYKEKRKSKEKKGKKAKADKAAVGGGATLPLRDIGKESMDELASSVGMRRATMTSVHSDPEELFSVRFCARPAAVVCIGLVVVGEKKIGFFWQKARWMRCPAVA